MGRSIRSRAGRVKPAQFGTTILRTYLWTRAQRTSATPVTNWTLRRTIPIIQNCHPATQCAGAGLRYDRGAGSCGRGRVENGRETVEPERLAHLQESARRLRRTSLEMIAAAGSGHPGGSLSAAD